MGRVLDAQCAKGFGQARGSTKENVRVEKSPWAASLERLAVEIGVVSQGVACRLSPGKLNNVLALCA